MCDTKEPYEATTIEHNVPGLQQPAEIIVDRWGIPHIRAATQHDVFFVQGFNAARDRLWQLDIWRKRGLGHLAADFGPGFLAQDRAARLFLYRGDIDAEWASHANPDARTIVEAFTSGINAWIALTERQPELLPPEFTAMDTRPHRWEATDVLRIRSHGLLRNVLSEVQRAQVVARAGLEADLLRRSIDPPWTPTVPEGLDPSDVPANVLDVFKLATVRLDFSPERLAATLDDAMRWVRVDEAGDVYSEGSNNWAVSGRRTASGRPIMASDPHRPYSLPAPRHVVHLTGPGIDVIGAGEPAHPGISLGHNGRAAFGLTTFQMDQEDLYVYETNPNDPDQFRYGDGWERMRSIHETIAVRGASDQEVVLKFTRHGPVVFENPAKQRAFAVRSVWFEPGASSYFASIACLDVASPEDHARALSGLATPPMNHVYGDCDGNIAWVTVGKAPIRPNWDGLLPVPGDGRYEWAGFYPFEELPKAVNPPRGFVATANEMNLPANYPYHDRKLGFEWAEWSRARRIHAVLDAQPKHTMQESMQLQTDAFSIPASRLGTLLIGLSGAGDAAIGLDLLRKWDFVVSCDSAAATLSELWWCKHLRPALLQALAPDPELRRLLAPGDTETLLAIMEQPGRLSDRAALLTRTLAEAVADCRHRLGPDPAGWAWGRLHHGYFEHMLSTVAAGMRDVGPLPTGGASQTPMHAGYRLSDFRVTSGAALRMVIDIGKWDNSRVINAPGQSGDPRSPHYDDLATSWAAGEYVPLLYSREAVDNVAQVRFVLIPG